jgi:hypothetical protein
MHFKSERDRASENAMAELAKEAQELEMGWHKETKPLLLIKGRI